MSHSQELVILPSLGATLAGAGKVRITAKFIEGMRQYAKHWPGHVTAILHPDDSEYSGNLDNVVVDADQDGFSFRVLRFDGPELLDALSNARLVQGGANHLLNHVPEFCKRNGIPYVFVSEYSLRTRRQIIAAETNNPILRARRYLWAWNQERKNEKNVRLSAGVQCNGTPTFDAYSPLNDRTLLYFDTRVSSEMFAGRANVVSRIESLRQGAPIRLAFSGRLHRMKGVDHLPVVASLLREAKVPFEMDICGDGPLLNELRSDIERRNLSEHVRARGTLDFATELMPFISSEIDLFVCCHRQGDPSCTYLETLACGVPIVGYDNEAFSGLLRECPVGWETPLDDPKKLASAIEAIYREPDRLAVAAQRAVSFAREHLADVVFERRVAHMREIARV